MVTGIRWGGGVGRPSHAASAQLGVRDSHAAQWMSREKKISASLLG